MTGSAAAAGSVPRARRRRYRERFRGRGLDGFYGCEVLELLLGYATAGDADEAARALVERFNGIRGAFDATAAELSSVPGVGPGAVVLIRLIKALSVLYMKERMTGVAVAGSSAEMLDYLRLALSGERVEKFMAVYLDAAGRIAAVEMLHEGTINQTAVYPRKAIEMAFAHRAAGVVFAHNHPSGSVNPSDSDRRLSAALDRAARSVDLTVYDHIIIGRDSHYSARQGGWTFGR